MINEEMFALGDAPNAIRSLFQYGLNRKAEIGAENVFDFSIGNPSVPAPEQVTRALRDLLDEPSLAVHGYTPSMGDMETRTATAESLNRRFGGDLTGDNVFMTDGASTAISVTLKGIIEPGVCDGVIVPSPFFPEYRTWVQAHGGTLIEVPARESDFQLDVPAIQAAIDEHTKAVIINSPNNPVGTVYTPQILSDLAKVLVAAERRYGHPIFLISDEPYRELVYGDATVSWMPDLYDDTLVCYSWSKSLSLPGERIGYVLVPNRVTEWHTVFKAIAGGARALGFICAGSMYQKVITRCVDVMPDIKPYERNRQLLTALMDECGFEYVQPDGAFYLWVKALEPDAKKFSERAKAHELLVVPSDGFGVTGWVRLGYCVDEKTITGSAEAFKALHAEYATEPSCNPTSGEVGER